ncbi:MAG TPA: 1,4-alpha-glucan branching protein domain-containing protein [Methylomirabilota bacterium]|nr:1,4-alpha-glucan branching protein domain-containing protein [Methylomirabilota bacterium]
MQGYLAIVLHAHLPFVRHPEHERFLEENWLYEAMTESYLPLLQVLEGWARDGVPARLTLSISPTLSAMLVDPLLQSRYERHLERLIELAEKERHRTRWEPGLEPLAAMYLRRFVGLRETWCEQGRDLTGAFRRFHEAGLIELITTAATHALLPLMAGHEPSLRAQILAGRDAHRSAFGSAPRGFWLPECAYTPEVEPVLQGADIRWFITDTHGLLHARPRPRYRVFAPVFTPSGLAVFGRDLESARQIWSRQEGYPGDARYRDFYRDIGFDLDFDYVRPYVPGPDQRGFTGIKYHRITGGTDEKLPYDREAALRAVDGHANHFLEARIAQIERLAGIMDRPPILVAPYDAELFGHWWYEGPEFLDWFVRKTCYDQKVFELITPSEYLRRHPTQQVARPSPSSWGEEGYWRVWLNESNAWIQPHLGIAQERMTGLARLHPDPPAGGLVERALKQAGRELMLAQSSDWPFILRTGTSPDYARTRVKEHLLRFIALHEQLTATRIDEPWLARVEGKDNLFPGLEHRYWK